jgi:hypothetical protein
MRVVYINSVRIRESKNLKFDLFPYILGADGGKLDPELCIMDSFERADDKITLYFKNGGRANIKGLDVEGGREIDMIEMRIIDLMGKNYREILDSNVI